MFDFYWMTEYFSEAFKQAHQIQTIIGDLIRGKNRRIYIMCMKGKRKGAELFYSTLCTWMYLFYTSCLVFERV